MPRKSLIKALNEKGADTLLAELVDTACQHGITAPAAGFLFVDAQGGEVGFSGEGFTSLEKPVKCCVMGAALLAGYGLPVNYYRDAVDDTDVANTASTAYLGPLVGSNDGRVRGEDVWWDTNDRAELQALGIAFADAMSCGDTDRTNEPSK